MEGATHEVFGEVIYRYTRKQALEDGEFVDVSSVSHEAGIKFPVALTRTVWDKYVEIPEGVEGQDVNGRLWDIVWMLRANLKRGESELLYELLVRNDNRKPCIVTLKAMCGPDDNMNPVITVMLPEED